MKKSSNSNSVHSIFKIKLNKMSNCNFELNLNFLRTNFSTLTLLNKFDKFPEILYNSSDIINSFSNKLLISSSIVGLNN